MPPEQKTDAALMEPAPQGHTIPAETPAAPAQPQGQAPAAPAAAPAAPSPAAPRPSAAPASPAPAAAQPNAEPAPAPALVSIIYDGKTFNVSPEVAEAWNKRQAAFDGGYKKTFEELKELKDRLPAPPKAAAPTEEEIREKLATRLLTEPDRVFAEIKEEVKRELSEAYKSDIAARDFQSRWWTDNKELIPYRGVFDALLLQNSGQYIKDGLTDSQAYDRNADVVRKLILSIRSTTGAPPGAPASQHVESPAPPSGGGAVSEPAGESAFTSMTDAMRARRKMKSEAALSGTKVSSAA